MTALNTRARAIEGLRAIAAHEAAVAAMIDEPGSYFGELAAWLQRSSCKRARFAEELAGDAPVTRPRLRVVSGGRR
jgi:hypothetical protein